MGTADERPPIIQTLLSFGSMIALDDFDMIAEMHAQGATPSHQPRKAAGQLGLSNLASEGVIRYHKEKDMAMVFALFFYGRDFRKIADFVDKQVRLTQISHIVGELLTTSKHTRINTTCRIQSMIAADQDFNIITWRDIHHRICLSTAR